MPDKNLLLIDIDGILPEVLYETLDDPKSALHAVAGRGLRVERAVTIFPSVTLCCQASLFTGVFPNKHYIVGNSWFDRAMDPPFFRIYTTAGAAAGNYGFALFGWPTLILPQRPAMQFANNDMNADASTLYESAHAAGRSTWEAYNQYSRGVDRWIKPTRPQMILFAVCHEEKLDNFHWDRSNFRRINAQIRRFGLPDIFTVYISGHDNNSHENGPADQRRYFRQVVDPLFGTFLRELQRHRPLDEFHFLITADHGQAATRKEKEFIVTIEILFEILGAADGGGFRLAERERVDGKDSAVVSMEAGSAQFYLINRKTFRWPDPPRFEEDVLAAARAFEPYRTGKPPFVEHILVRRSVAEGYVGYRKGEIISLEKYFDGLENEYPDAVRRIRGLNSPRSGDLLILHCYRGGYYFGDKVKAGEHGSLHAVDSCIPLVLSGPGIPDKIIPTASIVDVVPTVGRVMGFDTPHADGRSLL